MTAADLSNRVAALSRSLEDFTNGLEARPAARARRRAPRGGAGARRRRST